MHLAVGKRELEKISFKLMTCKNNSCYISSPLFCYFLDILTLDLSRITGTTRQGTSTFLLVEKCVDRGGIMGEGVSTGPNYSKGWALPGKCSGMHWLFLKDGSDITFSCEQSRSIPETKLGAQQTAIISITISQFNSNLALMKFEWTFPTT